MNIEKDTAENIDEIFLLNFENSNNIDEEDEKNMNSSIRLWDFLSGEALLHTVTENYKFMNLRGKLLV